MRMVCQMVAFIRSFSIETKKNYFKDDESASIDVYIDEHPVAHKHVIKLFQFNEFHEFD